MSPLNLSTQILGYKSSNPKEPNQEVVFDNGMVVQCCHIYPWHLNDYEENVVFELYGVVTIPGQNAPANKAMLHYYQRLYYLRDVDLSLKYSASLNAIVVLKGKRLFTQHIYPKYRPKGTF